MTDALSQMATKSDHMAKGPKGIQGRAINCTPLSKLVGELVRDSLALNSRRAYASDLARFKAWGGTIPASQEAIAEYLAAHQQSHAASTLSRWLASLAKAHRAIGVDDPTKLELVRSVVRGIRRTRGSAPRQAKALLRDELFAVLDCLGDDTRSLRDRALLLLGFACGFRRSELTALKVNDLDFVQQGLIVHLRRSKTDQTGNGRKIGVPLGRTRHCPIGAVRVWLERAQIVEGPLFRSISRGGSISNVQLNSDAVSRILKRRLERAGYQVDGYSGHSLRSGFVTSAVQAGVSPWKVRQQTGHASDAMLARYVRDFELFQDNGAGELL